MALDVYLTNACNLQCKFCFNFDNADAPRIALPDVCAILTAAHEKGHRYVSITGGEPFLYKDLFRVIDHAHELGLWVQLLSHGGLLNDERINRLKQYWRVRVRISLDGGTSATHDSLRGAGTFAATTHIISKLAEAGVNTGIGMTVSERNVSEIEEVVSFCIANGVSFIRFSPVARIRKGKAADVDNSLHARVIRSVIELTIRYRDFMDIPSDVSAYSPSINSLTTRRCMAGSRFFGVSPDAQILPCPLISEHPSIHSRTFKSKETFDEVTAGMDGLFGALSQQLKGICATCEFREVCYGGCLAEKLSFERAFVDEQPVCTKIILEDLAANFEQQDFEWVVRSWVARLRQGLEASDSHACMRQAPYWSMNFRRPDAWGKDNSRFN